MTGPKMFLATSLAVLGLPFCVALPAHAQGPNSMRVVRLSRADGEVLVLHSGDNDWE